jgi:hypothetical protein
MCERTASGPDARVQLARMPFELGQDVARLVPALRLIAQAGVIARYLMGRSPDQALQQVSYPVLQDPIGRQADRVARTFGFE